MDTRHEVHIHLRDAVARGVGAVGLAGVALIHLLDLPGKFSETPYMAWMYIGLIASAILLAGVLVLSGDPRAWPATALLALAVIVGFTLDRTVGLPQAHGDVGNWAEPLGMASLFVEGALVALGGAMTALTRPARAGARRVAPPSRGVPRNQEVRAM
jgi:hypothetical protein